MSDEGPVTPRVLALSEDTTVRQPWERQEGEGEREWGCFEAYRNMNPRNLHVCGMVGQIRVASAELSSWYRKWRWEDRVNAYDVLTDRIVQAQRKKSLERTTEDWMAQKLAALDTLDKILDLELGKYLEVAASGGSPGLVKPADIKGLMEMSIKARRLLNGETTENIGVGETDISNMPMDEVVAWHERLKGERVNKPS